MNFTGNEGLKLLRKLKVIHVGFSVQKSLFNVLGFLRAL